MREGLPEESVTALNKLFRQDGSHRAIHAKGVLCKGTFEAAPEAATLTRAAHMNGEQVPVTIRFSGASGKPDEPDWKGKVRGLAAKFHLPETDIVATTLPRFVARDPEDLVMFTRALRPAHAWRLPWYLLTHREAFGAIRAIARAQRLPSYANFTYFAVHAYRWMDANGGDRFLRYSWVPESRADPISKRAAKKLGANHLADELGDRLAGDGKVRFTLRLQLHGEGDPLDDPTAVWPAERPTVDAGTLTITDLETDPAADRLVFDPARLVDGIDPSDDRILHFRPRAYDVSHRRRTGVS